VPSGDAEKFGARRMLALMFAPLAAFRLEKAKVIRSGDHLTTKMAAERQGERMRNLKYNFFSTTLAFYIY